MNMDTIYDVCDFLDTIEDINCGGCGIAALAMYRWLKKNNKLKGDEQFVYLYYMGSDDLYKDNQKYLDGKSEKIFAASHVVLFHDGCYLDSHGIKTVGGCLKHKISDENIIIKSLQNYSYWNSDFERNKNIPKISRKLGIKLNDVKIPEGIFKFLF